MYLPTFIRAFLGYSLSHCPHGVKCIIIFYEFKILVIQVYPTCHLFAIYTGVSVFSQLEKLLKCYLLRAKVYCECTIATKKTNNKNGKIVQKKAPNVNLCIIIKSVTSVCVL